ncbi:MAG: 3-oxoacyl-ACP synthase [Bacteroidia bacterium]|nr:3-oxoacyl-ACP synthase [Bacteroidia bacterium]
MDTKFGIRKFAGIRDGVFFENENRISEQGSLSFDEWMDQIYKTSIIAYPKFHKMDRLSKLGFATSEVLLKDLSIHKGVDPDKIAVVLANKSSSLDTDIHYQNLLKKGVSSPAVFVYTLPNILIGEICIRNKIKGESVFFISDSYNITQQFNYINIILKDQIADTCIGGWVEMLGDRFESFLYLVTKEDKDCISAFSEENLTNSYNKIR